VGDSDLFAICMKNKNIHNPTSNETATIPKIVIFEACILNQYIKLYQQPQSKYNPILEKSKT